MLAGEPFGLAFGLTAALVFGVAALTQAHGVRLLDDPPTAPLPFALAALRQPWLVLTGGLYLAGFGAHVVAIEHLPLYLAQAAIALSLAVTAIGVGVLHERLRPHQWLAIAMVCAGLLTLAAAAGEPGPPPRSPWAPLLLWAGFVALALPVALGRVRSGVALGAIAGLCYAGVAVSVRGVATLDSGILRDPVSLACAAAVAAYGLGGFWTYSLGLDRTSVSAATAPLVTAEVAGPALVGLALLGDGVAEHGWPLLAVGLLLSVIGSAVVSHTTEDRLAGPV